MRISCPRSLPTMLHSLPNSSAICTDFSAICTFYKHQNESSRQLSNNTILHNYNFYLKAIKHHHHFSLRGFSCLNYFANCSSCEELFKFKTRNFRYYNEQNRALKPLIMESTVSDDGHTTKNRHFHGSTSQKSVCSYNDHQLQASDDNQHCSDVGTLYYTAFRSKLSDAFDCIHALNVSKLPQGEVVVLDKSEERKYMKDNFNLNLYMEMVTSNIFGRLLIWSPCLPSTHTFLSENFKIFPVGTTCVADIQLNGRGRGKNQWESPLGCLMYSFTLQMENGCVLPLLQYVVSLAVIEAIETVCQQKCLPIPNVKIKWPNDIYAEGLKIGGVLCTSRYTSKKFNVTVGIGLNVDNEKPTKCLNSIIGELTTSKDLPKREELLAAFFGRFEILFNIFMNDGFAALEENYYNKWLHSEQKVILEERQEQQDNPTTVLLTVKGLTPSGYLLAVDETCNKYELHPDGNSFDFFKGLVRKKLME